MYKKILIGYLFALATLCSAAELPELIQQLGSKDYDQQHAAREQMQALMADASQPGSDAEKRAVLEQQLLDAQAGMTNNLASRLWVIRMLEWFGSDAVVSSLMPLLQDAEPKVREAAGRALAANPSPDAGKALLKALEKAPVDEQAGLIDALAYRGDTKAAKAIAGFLGSEDDRVVEVAAVALGTLGQKKSGKKLAAAAEGASDGLLPVLEAAELQIGVDAKRAESLIQAGSRSSVRVEAFRQLAAQKPEQAAEVLQQILQGEGNPARQEMLRAAMVSDQAALSESLIEKLPELHESAQLVIVGAVADRGLTAYEGALLSMLESSEGAFRNELIRTLGVIGGADSFDPLYGLFMGQSTPELVAALVRLNVPEVDERLLASLDREKDEQKRIAAMHLLALRMPEGAVAKLNSQTSAAQPEAVRKAAIKELETAGNAQSAALLAGLIVDGDPLKKSVQQSLKRLSVNMKAGDQLWDKAYGPALERAADDAAREDILVILDGIAGTKSLAYLKGLVLDPGHALHNAGIQSLSRWPDSSAGTVWMELFKKEGLSVEDMQAAQKGLIRLINQGNGDFKLAVRAVQTAATPEQKQALVAGIKVPGNGRQKMMMQRALKALENDPDVGPQIRELLAR